MRFGTRVERAGKPLGNQMLPLSNQQSSKLNYPRLRMSQFGQGKLENKTFAVCVSVFQPAQPVWFSSDTCVEVTDPGRQMWEGV